MLPKSASAGSQDAWVYFNQTPATAGHIMEIIGKGGGGTDFDLQAETDNRFRFYIAGGNNVASSTTIQTNVWYHVAGTWDGTELKMYVNGVLENTNPVQNLTRGQSGNPLDIGYQPSFGGRFFNGLIDEAEIFDRALSELEIQSIVNAGNAGKCKQAPCGTVSLSPSSLPNGTAGFPYNQTITASGGTSPYSFTVTTGALPPGFTLNPSGQISGSTNATGTYLSQRPLRMRMAALALRATQSRSSVRASQ